MKNIKSWFSDLSWIARISILSSLVLGGIFTVSAISTSQDTPDANPLVNTIKDTVPIITTKIETETESIPFTKQTIESDSLANGTTELQTAGIDGIKTTTYTITLTDGIETNRTSLEKITQEPVTEITLLGTYIEPVKTTSNCDPNYSGCVPIASDVDCGGGSGNGPAYVYGAVQVIGDDIYELDRDGDGWGCE